MRRRDFLTIATALAVRPALPARADEHPDFNLPALIGRMREIVQDDVRLADEMKAQLAVDCTIGFESEIYDYSYSRETIEGKIRHDRETAATVARWEASGSRPCRSEYFVAGAAPRAYVARMAAMGD